MSKFTVEFSEKMDSIITELARQSGTTKIEVLRRSVALFDYVYKELKDGTDTKDNQEKINLSLTTSSGEVIKDIIIP